MNEEAPTVLLVEADILIRSPLAEYLRECGYHVLEANSTAEARRHVSEGGRLIDVIMVEVSAPDEGGFSLASWIRKNHPEIDVLLAGTIEMAARKAADLCEEMPSISKPYDHQLIIERIRRMMASRNSR
jgi:DNA-binding NtrC family response regulator